MRLFFSWLTKGLDLFMLDHIKSHSALLHGGLVTLVMRLTRSSKDATSGAQIRPIFLIFLLLLHPLEPLRIFRAQRFNLRLTTHHRKSAMEQTIFMETRPVPMEIYNQSMPRG